MPAYVTVAQVRALPNLGDAAKFTDAEITDAISWFETTFEDFTHVAWTPRTRTVTLESNPDGTVTLPDLLPRRVVSVRTYTGPTAYTDFTADELAGIMLAGSGVLRRWSGRFSGRVEVTYEYGYGAPPSDVVEAAKVAIRDRLLNDNVGNRQYSVQTEAGIVRSSTPGPDRPFGLPVVDEVANRRRLDTGQVASVVIA